VHARPEAAHLVAGATFNLHTRLAAAAGCFTSRSRWRHARCRSIGLCRTVPVRAFSRHSHRARLGDLEAWPTGRLGGGSSTRCRRLPGLAEHGCSYQEPGGFFRRMREDEGTCWDTCWNMSPSNCRTWPARRSRSARPAAPASGRVHVVYEYSQRDEGIAAGELGLTLLCSLLPRTSAVRLRAERWAWEERAMSSSASRSAARSASTASLVRAAENRGFPGCGSTINRWCNWPRQVPAAHTGYGHEPHLAHCGRTRRRQGRDQQDTGHARASGAKQELVQSAAQAVRAARRIGFPVVTKPYNGNHAAESPSPHHRRGRRAGLRRRARTFEIRDRRDLPRGR